MFSDGGSYLDFKWADKMGAFTGSKFLYKVNQITQVLRNYWYFNGLNAYGEFPPETYADDFDFNIDVQFRYDSNEAYIGGNASDSSRVLVFGPASFDPGRLRVELGGVISDFAGFVTVESLELNNIRIKREAGLITVYKNNSQFGTALNSGVGVFRYLYQDNGAQFAVGVCGQLDMGDNRPLWILKNPWTTQQQFVDERGSGAVLQMFNFQESDVIQELV